MVQYGYFIICLALTSVEANQSPPSPPSPSSPPSPPGPSSPESPSSTGSPPSPSPPGSSPMSFPSSLLSGISPTTIRFVNHTPQSPRPTRSPDPSPSPAGGRDTPSPTVHQQSSETSQRQPTVSRRTRSPEPPPPIVIIRPTTEDESRSTMSPRSSGISSQCDINLTGRKGYNEEINGLYEVADNTFNRRPYFVSRSPMLVLYLYFYQEAGYWVVSQMLGSDKVFAYVPDDANSPETITDIWVFWDGDIWAEDLDVSSKCAASQDDDERQKQADYDGVEFQGEMHDMPPNKDLEWGLHEFLIIHTDERGAGDSEPDTEDSGLNDPVTDININSVDKFVTSVKSYESHGDNSVEQSARTFDEGAARTSMIPESRGAGDILEFINVPHD